MNSIKQQKKINDTTKDTGTSISLMRDDNKVKKDKVRTLFS